jgi:hypothetical protein
MKIENIQKNFKKVYAILRFTDKEADDALNGLAGVQQAAIANELLKTLNREEADQIGAISQKSDEEKKAAMEQIAKAHAGDEGFKVAAQAAAKKVLDEHIAYLKTRGDEGQKAEIAKILAEIE